MPCNFQKEVNVFTPKGYVPLTPYPEQFQIFIWGEKKYFYHLGHCDS